MLFFVPGIGLYAQTGESSADGVHEKILEKIEHQLQRKDTKLLCLDGCASDLDGTDDGKNRHWVRSSDLDLASLLISCVLMHV